MSRRLIRLAARSLATVLLVISVPVRARPAPAPSSVTATVARLSWQLDWRARTEVDTELQAALRRHPLERLPAPLRLDVALLMLKLRGLGEASAISRSALAEIGPVGPATAAPLVERVACAHALLGELDQARAIISACLTRTGAADRCDVRPLLAVLRCLSRHDPAVRVADAAVAAGGLTLAARLELSSVYQEADRTDRAEAVLRAALAAYPGNPRVLERLGILMRHAGRWQPWLEELEGLWRTHPRTRGILAAFEMAFRNLQGSATRRDGPREMYREVEAELLERAATDPADAPAGMIAATLAIDDARYDDALGDLRAIAPGAPADSRPIALQGLVTLWKGDPAGASRLLDRAAAIDPFDVAIDYGRSLVARARGDLPAAAAQLQRFLERRRDLRAVRYRVDRDRVLADLHALRHGHLPEDLDRPDHPKRRYRPDSLHEPFELPPPATTFGALGALLGGGLLGLWWGSRE